MEILLVAGLVVVAAMMVTLPWGRRDPAAFSAADVGYVRGGPTGAVLAVLGVLYLEGFVDVRSRGGYRRTGLPLPADAEPLARAVHAALAEPARLRTILGAWGVRRAVEVSATRVYSARLRTGEARRFVGVAVAFAAVVVAVVALVADGVDPVGLGVAGVALVGMVLLWRTRFVTVAGRRLLREVRRSVVSLPAPPERRLLREPVHADTRLENDQVVFAHAAVHLGVAAGLGATVLPGDEWPAELTSRAGDSGAYDGGLDGGGFDGGGGGGDGGF